MARPLPLSTRLAAAAAALGLAAAAVAAPAMSAAAIATPAAGSDVVWTHNPASPRGPAAWGKLDPQWAACGSGVDQSPVVVTGTQSARLPALRIDYPRTPLVVENTGHVVEVPQPPTGGSLTVGDHRYQLVQWHVHAPAEHVVAGHRADLEIHLVHSDAQGNTAVVAVFADLARSPRPAGPHSAAALLRTTLRAAPERAGEETAVGKDVSAAQLLETAGKPARSGRTVSDYLTYRGSLTTPPCTTGATWFLLPDSVRVDADTVTRLHRLIASFPAYGGYPDNNRPVQPLCSRTVLRRAG